MVKIIEHNAATGEVIEREMTAKELSDFEKSTFDLVAQIEQEQEARAAYEAAKTSAALKLESLGLTAEEIAAITGA